MHFFFFRCSFANYWHQKTIYSYSNLLIYLNYRSTLSGQLEKLCSTKKKHFPLSSRLKAIHKSWVRVSRCECAPQSQKWFFFCPARATETRHINNQKNDNLSSFTIRAVKRYELTFSLHIQVDLALVRCIINALCTSSYTFTRTYWAQDRPLFPSIIHPMLLFALTTAYPVSLG